MKKRLMLFGLIYFALDLASILIVFAWKSFGGSESMTFLQKAITFFFTFPSNLILNNGGNILRLQQLLGHTYLISTLIYLKYATFQLRDIDSPLDLLYRETTV